jgi:membrane protein required for colicin V production
MNVVDIGILILIGFNAILGLMRGAVWQILRIVSIVLGIMIAQRYGEVVLEKAPESFRTGTSYAIIITRLVLFLAVYIVMFGVTHMVKALIDKVKLGSIDKMIGAAVGAAKGAAFCCIILYVQYIPPVSNFDIVHDHLYGNGTKNIPKSKGNEFFITKIKPELDKNLPKELTTKVNDSLSKAAATFK